MANLPEKYIIILFTRLPAFYTHLFYRRAPFHPPTTPFPNLILPSPYRTRRMVSHTRILVVRDSDVACLSEFLLATPPDYEEYVSLDMGLGANIVFHGIGGCTTEKIGLHDLQFVKDLDPHIIILMVGGNDLCDPNASPLRTASDIHDLAVTLVNIVRCHRVFACSIPPRATYPHVLPPSLTEFSSATTSYATSSSRGGNHLLENTWSTQPGVAHILVGRHPFQPQWQLQTVPRHPRSGHVRLEREPSLGGHPSLINNIFHLSADPTTDQARPTKLHTNTLSKLPLLLTPFFLNR